VPNYLVPFSLCSLIIIIVIIRSTGTSEDMREMSYLFQRLSVIIQVFNSVFIYDSFVSADEEPDL